MDFEGPPKTKEELEDPLRGRELGIREELLRDFINVFVSSESVELTHGKLLSVFNRSS